MDFNSDDSVMIKRGGYSLWINQLVNDGDCWHGTVTSITHPDFELGDAVGFKAEEVRDKEA